MKNEATYIARENKWCAQNYHPLSVVLTKGEGAWLWDIKGGKYLDMMLSLIHISEPTRPY